jgi:hypothetical protein
VTTCRQTFESKEHNVQISLIASTLERFWRCKVMGMRESHRRRATTRIALVGVLQSTIGHLK